jgi:hypothetical protein
MIAWLGGVARAEDPRRSVAVLEFRSDSSALPDIGTRFASLLGSRTSLKVLGDDQARQRYGTSLDADVVACDGEAKCIGRVGQKLGVAEVMLIGVSELGDVILTVQRIDSKSGKVRARLAEALAADSAPEDDGLAAYLGRVLPAEDFVRFGTIVIKVNVAGAEVIVGGESRGQSPIPDLRLPAPATYPIEVKKLGYLPFKAEVEVPPDANMRVNANLTKPGQGGGAWYTKWYVGAGAGVLLAGAITGAVLLSRERDSVPIGGEIQ